MVSYTESLKTPQMSQYVMIEQVDYSTAAILLHESDAVEGISAKALYAQFPESADGLAQALEGQYQQLQQQNGNVTENNSRPHFNGKNIYLNAKYDFENGGAGLPYIIITAESNEKVLAMHLVHLMPG